MSVRMGVAYSNGLMSWGDAAEDAAPGSRGNLRVGEVYEDGQVRIVSDSRVTQAQAKTLADRIEKAWGYDAAVQKWDDPRRLGGELTVAVLSRNAFGQMTGDYSGATAGVTTGPDLFAVPVDVLGRKSAQDENTIAHELGHVQDFREGGRRLQGVPIYAQEGKEYVLGETYPLHERMKNPHLKYVADSLAQLSGSDAQWLMKNFRKASDEQRGGNVGFLGEVTGALFVEFLRVRMNHPKAVQELADVIADVGAGATYDDAFRKHFGMSSAQAENAFVQFVHETERSPRERLKGTIFET